MKISYLSAKIPIIPSVEIKSSRGEPVLQILTANFVKIFRVLCTMKTIFVLFFSSKRSCVKNKCFFKPSSNGISLYDTITYPTTQFKLGNLSWIVRFPKSANT